MVNLFVFQGNATKDAEVRYDKDGKPSVAKINIAVNRDFKKEGQPDADFFQLTLFGGAAGLMDRFGKKGAQFIFQGRIQNDNYEKDGKTVYSFAFLVNQVSFAGNKGGNTSAPAENGSVATPAPTGDDSFMNIPETGDQKLPF